MKRPPLLQQIAFVIPLVLSGILAITIFFLLWLRLREGQDFADVLGQGVGIVVGISAAMSGIILVYMMLSATGMRKDNLSTNSVLGKLTQKMHNFRSIVELLMNSKMWMPGLKEYIDDEFEGLSFFDVKEFYKGRSKLAIEFLQENSPYQDTENLYLELKSLLSTSLKEKNRPESLSYPTLYPNELVKKWLEHKCGSGLWYFFGYKYGSFKEALDFNAVYERHQDKIMTLANSIDSEAFEDSSFNEVFLSKLGEHMSNEVLPKLFQLQSQVSTGLPRTVTLLYAMLMTFLLFGIMTPMAFLLLGLPAILLVISYSVVFALVFFICLSIYPFLRQEIKVS